MSDEQRDTGTWDGLIEYLTSLGHSPDEIEDEFDQHVRLGGGRYVAFTRSGEWLDWGNLHGRNRIKKLIEAARNRPKRATWRNVETWTERDFIEHVRLDRESGGTGGYRSVARRCEGWSHTALLRRWQRVSGGKAWPSGKNAPPHRR